MKPKVSRLFCFKAEGVDILVCVPYNETQGLAPVLPDGLRAITVSADARRSACARWSVSGASIGRPARWRFLPYAPTHCRTQIIHSRRDAF